MRAIAPLATAIAGAALLAGCSAGPSSPGSTPSAASSSSGSASPSPTPPSPTSPSAAPSTASATPAPSTAPAAPSTAAAPTSTSVVGAVVRFTTGSTRIDVTIDRDTPAARDFLSKIPSTLEFEDFSNSEKIAYLPRRLNVGNTPGSSPKNGDFSYYKPWGNIIFYYNAHPGYSADVLHLGTYRATQDQLEALDGSRVAVEIVR